MQIEHGFAIVSHDMHMRWPVIIRMNCHPQSIDPHYRRYRKS